MMTSRLPLNVTLWDVEEEGSIQLGEIISPLYVSNCLPNFLQILLLLSLFDI
jgi:hypothetical protein